VLTLTFTGDVRFRLRPGGPGPDQMQFAPEIVDALRRSDYAVFNIEGPITEAPPQKTLGAIVQNSPTFLPVLERLHCSVFNLANNHIFDHGLQGYRDTIAAARRCGWQWLGAGENLDEASAPLVLHGEDVSVGLISVCHQEGPIAGPSSPGVFCHTMTQLIRHRIQALKQQCDHVGVVYHGGEEIHRLPTPSRRKRLIGYVNAGADFVVAHHAHVVQGYEHVGGKPVFYGLGDFAFDYDFSTPDPAVNESVLLTMRFEKGQEPKFETVFTCHDRAGGHIQKIAANAWFRRISAEQYAADYGSYARQVFRQWMAIADNPRPSLLRRLRRMASGFRNPYQRQLIIAGVRRAMRELLHGSKTQPP